MNFDKVWYNSLKRSSLTPPDWVFGVVWPILYILIIASGVLYFSAGNVTTLGIAIYIVQWLLNVSWSPVFFQLKKIWVSFVIIILMVISVLITFFEFYKSSQLSAWVLVPYIIWISFASYLNGYICWNN